MDFLTYELTTYTATYTYLTKGIRTAWLTFNCVLHQGASQLGLGQTNRLRLPQADVDARFLPETVVNPIQLVNHVVMKVRSSANPAAEESVAAEIGIIDLGVRSRKLSDGAFDPKRTLPYAEIDLLVRACARNLAFFDRLIIQS